MMRKQSQSIQSNQQLLSQHQQPPAQNQDILFEGEKLSAEQIKEFLQESRQNTESSNFDETIKNQQKMEKIMLKQTFLEANQLFDPIEYFGGLRVNDLNEKVDDSRLSEMFKMKQENNDQEDIIAYHIQKVQNSLMNQKSVTQNNTQTQDKIISSNNNTPTASLLGYSISSQKSEAGNISTQKSFIKSVQSPVGSQINKKTINQQVSLIDKENCDQKSGVLTYISNFQQKISQQFKSPTNLVGGSQESSKNDQFTSPVNSQLTKSQIENSKGYSNQQGLNSLPLQPSIQNKQNQIQHQQVSFQSNNQQKQPQSSLLKKQNTSSTTKLKQTNNNNVQNEQMKSPEQILKQKSISSSSQPTIQSPFLFSFQSNQGVQNGVVSQFNQIQNQQENANKLNNYKKPYTPLNSNHASQNTTPVKSILSTKDVKSACIPNNASPSSAQVISQNQLTKKESNLNHMQLLQAVEQITIDSQRKLGEFSNISSIHSKNATPNSKIQLNSKSEKNILNKQNVKSIPIQSIENSQQQQNISGESTPQNFIYQSQIQSHNTSQIQQYSTGKQQILQGGEQFSYQLLGNSQINNNEKQLSFEDQIRINNQFKSIEQSQIVDNQQLFNQGNHKQENIEFYEQSNWQSVQQQNSSLVNNQQQQQQQLYGENNYLTGSNHGNYQVGLSATFQDSSLQKSERFNNFQDSITSQYHTLVKSGIHHQSQSKMFEQKLTSEQFFKDKENLELTFQEDTANINEDNEIFQDPDFNYGKIVDEVDNMIFAKQFRSESHQSPPSKSPFNSSSQRYATTKSQTAINTGLITTTQGQTTLCDIPSDTQLTHDNNYAKRQKVKCKSMVQGDIQCLINQKPQQDNYSSRNYSKESDRKKNTYFVQRQINNGHTPNKYKQQPPYSLSIAQKSVSTNVQSQTKLTERDANHNNTRSQQISYNNSKLSSSIMHHERSQLSQDKSQIINNTSILQNNNSNNNNNNNVNKFNNIINSSYTKQQTPSSTSNSTSSSNPKLFQQLQKKNSVQYNTKDHFLSPKIANKPSNHSIGQFSSVVEQQNKLNQLNPYTNLVLTSNTNKSTQQMIQSSKTNEVSVQKTIETTTNKSQLNQYQQFQQNNMMNLTNNNGISSQVNSSTYLKRPQGKSQHYDYRNIMSQVSNNNLTNNNNNSNINNSKPRLMSSPTHSPSNYKVKQIPSSQNNGQQTMRQKKVVNRLDHMNSSKNLQQFSSQCRDQSASLINSNNNNYTQNYTTNNQNVSLQQKQQQTTGNTLLSSMNGGNGVYQNNIIDNIDKDIKYNIAIDVKKQPIKVDIKYEDTLNHLLSMKMKGQNLSITQSSNLNNLTLNQQPSSVTSSTANLNAQNKINYNNINNNNLNFKNQINHHNNSQNNIFQ